MAEQTVLSVRGEARRTVPPDYAILHCGINATATSKIEATTRLRRAQDAVMAALEQLGGAARTVENEGAPLTWSIGTMSTHDEHDYDQGPGRKGATGRVAAHSPLTVQVRDLSQVGRVGQVLTEAERLHVHDASWAVDPANPAWRAVRADAIAAALDRGRDYAAAAAGAGSARTCLSRVSPRSRSRTP